MINKRRELEVKFYLGKKLSKGNKIEQKLLDNGFRFVESRIETDFLPDTMNSDCKRNNILFRIREVITKNDKSILITVKLRKPSSKFTDFIEIETSMPNIDVQTFNLIRKILKDTTGITLNNSIKVERSLVSIRHILEDQGYTKVRIYLDKFRREYKLDKVIATLDYFPDGMGLFLELEAYTPSDLNHVIKLLGLDSSTIITTDYGDLLKDHKKDWTAKEQREAVFSRKQSVQLLAK